MRLDYASPFLYKYIKKKTDIYQGKKGPDVNPGVKKGS